MDPNEKMYEMLAEGLERLKEASDETSPLDDFLSSDRVKVASLGDLRSFLRIGDDTLVHKAKKDLWRIGENESGEVIIERLFDPDSGKPLSI